MDHQEKARGKETERGEESVGVDQSELNEAWQERVSKGFLSSLFLSFGAQQSECVRRKKKTVRILSFTFGVQQSLMCKFKGRERERELAGLLSVN